ncbi:MAG: DUF89 family protein [Chloroflexi bacterium]|nr:DUF89 family protein [Chloroflexota bacterium]MBU1747504.1 DUF89 family protein [Chloroflexota bacterium]
MLTISACLPCIIDDAQAASALCVPDEDLRLTVDCAVLEHLREHWSYDVPPSYHITAVHRIIKRVAGLPTPFAEARRRANEVGLHMAAQVTAEAAAIPDDAARFRFLARWALAANSLDSRTAGTGYAFDPAHARAYFAPYLDRPPAVDQLDALFDLVRAAPEVLYIHDNVGEIALDAVFIRELRRHGCRVTSATRGGPITSDATMEDAWAVGLGQAADRLILAGPDTLGISFQEMSEDLRAALNTADLVIAKGQANYYVFSEYGAQVPGRVFALFTIKCEPVAQRWGVERRATVAAFLEPDGSG